MSKRAVFERSRRELSLDISVRCSHPESKAESIYINSGLLFFVKQLRTDGVHCRKYTGTGSVVLEVVPVTGAAFASSWTKKCAPPPLFLAQWACRQE